MNGVGAGDRKSRGTTPEGDGRRQGLVAHQSVKHGCDQRIAGTRHVDRGRGCRGDPDEALTVRRESAVRPQRQHDFGSAGPQQRRSALLRIEAREAAASEIGGGLVAVEDQEVDSVQVIGQVSRFCDRNRVDGEPIAVAALRIGQREHEIRRHIAVGEDPIGRGQAARRWRVSSSGARPSRMPMSARPRASSPSGVRTAT